MGEAMAFLPNSCSIPEEQLRVGYPVRALLKEVLPASRGDHQLILDRASSAFVEKLLELEIPEVFEGVVEIRDVVRTAGYKSKVVVSSNSKEIDPVGTCVGVGGVRIRPILKELGQEKIDLIEWTDDLERLVATALKPAEIDKVSVNEEERAAIVWLAQDQRSFAIGKQGQNIALVSRLTDLHVQLQEEARVQDISLPGMMMDNDDQVDQAELVDEESIEAPVENLVEQNDTVEETDQPTPQTNTEQNVDTNEEE
jgi:N utilization substance protein A